LPSSGPLEKRGGAKREAWTWLRLDGVSFTILPFEERDSVLRDYAGLLSSVKRSVLLARRVNYEYKYSDYSFGVGDTAFYLRAPAGSQVVYFNARPEEPARPRVKRLVNLATLELEDGSYVAFILIRNNGREPVEVARLTTTWLTTGC